MVKCPPLSHPFRVYGPFADIKPVLYKCVSKNTNNEGGPIYLSDNIQWDVHLWRVEAEMPGIHVDLTLASFSQALIQVWEVNTMWVYSSKIIKENTDKHHWCVRETTPEGLQETDSIGCPSDGSRFLKLFMVDFIPLKSKILSVLSLLPDNSREPVWSKSIQEIPFPWPASLSL